MIMAFFKAFVEFLVWCAPDPAHKTCSTSVFRSLFGATQWLHRRVALHLRVTRDMVCFVWSTQYICCPTAIKSHRYSEFRRKSAVAAHWYSI